MKDSWEWIGGLLRKWNLKGVGGLGTWFESRSSHGEDVISTVDSKVVNVFVLDVQSVI